ncbi:RagB/SusD family nutrient uptake outer membrane protein [Lutibacter aestuarii]|uniref:RagB/SusD family nutrient uptake outer membrane protein n=1 Tax=Lutibacter aestuarii TaxID=861111 RepID=A0ABW2ZC75_9FLAO
MKNLRIQLFFILAAFMLLAGLVSCVKAIEEEKFDFIQDTDIPDSEAGADLWVTGVYEGFSSMYRYNMFPNVYDMDCDYITGPSWAFSSFGAGNFQGSEHTQSMWEQLYNLIHRANFALENIEKMSNISSTHRANVTGELNFIKGYAYFMLVRAFGELPIWKHSVNSGIENVNQPRQSIPNVYEHIIELLTYAEENTYKNTDGSFIEGRVSAGVAAAFLSKVYITIGSASMPSGIINIKGGIPMETDATGNKFYTAHTLLALNKEPVAGYEEFDSNTYYKLAMDKAKQVIEGEYGSYDLLPYSSLWTQESKNKVEHMWSLQTISGDAIYGPQYPKSYSGTYDSNGYVISGKWYGMRDHWYKLFEENDLRIYEGVMHKWVTQNQNTFNGGSAYPSFGIWNERVKNEEYPYDDNRTYYSTIGSSNYLAYLTKYSFVSDNSIDRQDANWPFMRFAEVLLIYAEAANEFYGGPTQDALASINRVRERSLATPFSLAGNNSITDLISFRSAVIEERARELAAEGDRRWDLLRWGIYLKVMNSIGGFDEVGVNKLRTERHLLYPIPNTEINSNEAINENNPGW